MGADRIDVKRIELLLREAVGAVRLLDWTIAPGRTVDRVKRCCCPIGAVALVHKREGESHLETAARVLGEDFNAGSFAWGFDTPEALPKALLSADAGQLGARLRREWVPCTTKETP